MDIPINIAGVGVAFGPCVCHRDFHAGSIPRREFVVAVAEREGLDADVVGDLLLRLHNTVTDKLCACPEEKVVQVGKNAFICSGCGGNSNDQTT